MIVFLTSFPKCKLFSFVFSSVNENNYHSHSTSQMQIILIRIQLGKRKSFSFAFNFSNANRSHSYLHFRPPALPALMCESDNVSSKILREAAMVCANPTIIYFYRPGGWREYVGVCANPTIIFLGAARSLLQRSGGRESG